MKRVLRSTKKIVEHSLFRLFCWFPIDKRKIIFESEGDLSDNAYALYDYLMQNGYDEKYIFIWLTNAPVDKAEIARIPKWTRGISIRRLYALATCYAFIFDHNNIIARYPRRRDQKVINLFHGCTFKGSKGSIEVTNTEDMMPVTGEFWVPIMAKFIPCDEKKIVALGYPRNDYLINMENNKYAEWRHKYNWDSYSKVMLWMPTFRRSVNSALSEDYYSGATGLPIMETESDLKELNGWLSERNICIVFKVHHLQMDYPAFKNTYSNIQILKDEDIIKNGLQLYQVVALTDALITDYSSISNDYMLLDRPMIFTLDDYDNYRSSRGFSVDDPAQYFPGHHVFTKRELFGAIKDVSSGLDPYKDKRHELLPTMHKYQDGKSCKRIIDYIGL